jgi:hypothetical protein
MRAVRLVQEHCATARNAKDLLDSLIDQPICNLLGDPPHY